MGQRDRLVAPEAVEEQRRVVGALVRPLVGRLTDLGWPRAALARIAQLLPTELDALTALDGGTPGTAAARISDAHRFAQQLLRSSVAAESSGDVISDLEALECVAEIALARIGRGVFTEADVVRPVAPPSIAHVGEAFIQLVAPENIHYLAFAARLEPDVLARFRADQSYVVFDLLAQRPIGWLTVLTRLAWEIGAWRREYPEEWGRSPAVDAAFVALNSTFGLADTDHWFSATGAAPPPAETLPTLPWDDVQLGKWANDWAAEWRLYTTSERAALHALMEERGETRQEAKLGLVIEGMYAARRQAGVPQRHRVGSRGVVRKDVTPVKDLSPPELAQWLKTATLRAARAALPTQVTHAIELPESLGGLVESHRNGALRVLDDDDYSDCLEEEATVASVERLYELLDVLSPSLRELLAVALEYDTTSPAKLAALTGKSQGSVRQAWHRILAAASANAHTTRRSA